MQNVGLVPYGETLREYAVPGLSGGPEQKVSQLRAAGVSVGAASCSVALHLLANNKLKAAADLGTFNFLVIFKSSLFHEDNIIEKSYAAVILILVILPFQVEIDVS